MNELEKDYEIINDFPENSEKKRISQKYDVGSNKVSDIQKKLLYLMSVERKTRKDYTPEDVKWFKRLTNSVERYDKLLPFFENENKAFIEYLKAYQYKVLEKYGITKYIDNPSSGNLLMNQKYLLRYFKNIEKYLETKSEEFSDSVNNVKDIESVLERGLGDFKKSLIEFSEKNAEYVYGLKQENLEKISYLYNKAKSELEKGEVSDFIKARKNVNELKKKNEKLVVFFQDFKSVDEYKKEMRIRTERKFHEDVKEISSRLDKRGVNGNTLVINTVLNDPKFIELVISDGNLKLHCRSIIAAEYSEKMIPHMRFIMT